MKKNLLLTALLLTASAPCFQAMAEPEPQGQNQAVTTITGTVLDENDEPVAGATVRAKNNPTNATSTNFDGNFTLRVAPGTTLEVIFIGYQTEEVKAANDMFVYLNPTTQYLDEVVAIGYGTQKRVNLTGAVSTVDVARTLDNRSTGDVAKALQGAVPGLTITTESGSITSSGTAKIRIRGLGTLSNGETSAPLIVVDGVPVDDLSYVNPDDIAEISVLKDAASASIYGTRAAFGVLLVTTKQASVKDKVSVRYTNNFGWSHATKLPEYSSVPNQIAALQQVNYRTGEVNPELFGMYLENMLPYAKLWEQQNGGKKAGYRNMRPYVSDSDVGDYIVLDGTNYYYANWDVAGIMFSDAAPSQKHNVTLEGSSGKTSYRLAFGYDARNDLQAFNPGKMERFNVTSNIQTEIFSWLKAGLRFSWANKVYDAPNVASNANASYTYIWRWGSYFGPYGKREYTDADGNTTYTPYQIISARLDAGRYQDYAMDTRMQAWMEANPFKGFTLHADYTYDIQNYNSISAILPLTTWYSWTSNAKAPEERVNMNGTSASQSNSRATLWTVNVYGTYQFEYLKNHFKIMVGGTAEQYNYNSFGATKNVLGDVDLPYLALATGGDNGTDQSISNSLSHRATAGFFGRINYDWNNIWLLEFNGRYDGSSRFPANDRWAFFPSGSMGYRFSEEHYFDGLKNWWSNGKLRASYGEVGNEAIGSNMFIATIANSNPGWVNSAGRTVAGFGTPRLVSSTLKWERIRTLDIGVDFGFLNNSLNFTFDWFQRDTKDMLGPAMTLPAVLGAGAPQGNTASLRTNGWELGIQWNHSFGDANVYATFNIYDGKTKVTYYDNENKLISSIYTGCTYGDIWGFETDRYFTVDDFTWDTADGKWAVGATRTGYAPGIANQDLLQNGTFKYGPGDVKFKDLDGNGTITGGFTETNGVIGLTSSSEMNHGDLKVIGNALPRYEYSFRLGGSWKGFDIDMFFQGVGKRDMWYTSAFANVPFARGADATYANQESYNKIIYADDKRTIIGYEVDQNNKFPAFYPGGSSGGRVTGLSAGGYNWYPQTRYLLNMSYLRFKTLTVGYTLPTSITKKALIQRARVYFSADNLCFLHDGMGDSPIDPEIGGNWNRSSAYSNGTFGRTDPMMGTYSFGIQLTF